MLYPLANLANLLMWGLTFLGATWAYAKYRCQQDFFHYATWICLNPIMDLFPQLCNANV